MQTNVPNCSRIGLILQSMVDQSTIHQNQSNAGTIFCNRVDCRVIADSRQSHCNPVGTCHNSIFHPMVPTSHCQIRTQSNQSCHNPESPCYQIEMQWDLKTTKDCNVIDRIAKNCTDCRQIAATVRLAEGSTAIQTCLGNSKTNHAILVQFHHTFTILEQSTKSRSISE